MPKQKRSNGQNKGIVWTERTWNPVTGCDRVSPGCDLCYAMTQAAVLKTQGSPAYQNDGDPRTSGPGFKVTLQPDRLNQPLHWRDPQMVFVNSMSDLFHPQIPVDYIAQCFAVMVLAHHHTFQVLTKRPRRMRMLLNNTNFKDAITRHMRTIYPDKYRQLLEADGPYAGGKNNDDWSHSWWPLPNVWLGTSVEDQTRAQERIPVLLQTPAALRFISAEPLLGPVDLSQWLAHPRRDAQPMLDWVIVGGESGTGSRPMHPGWPALLRNQCAAAYTPFLFKQWGHYQPVEQIDQSHPTPVGRNGDMWVRDHETVQIAPWEKNSCDVNDQYELMRPVGKRASGRLLDGVEHLAMPTPRNQ